MRWTFLTPLLFALACTSIEEAGPKASEHGLVTTSVPTLGLNDVSVLFPLPASATTPGYLTPVSTGDRGMLLPRVVFDKVPAFPVALPDGLDYDRLRVVGARFDGCFQTNAGCEAQIRLVMQPIDDDGSSRDSALHLFYRLSPADLALVVADLRSLHALAPEAHGAPLDVHPALVQQGVTGAYGAAVTALLLRFAGDQNLTRMTFFLRAPPLVEVWFFGGFDRANDTLTPMQIVGVPNGIQRVIHTPAASGFAYDFAPVEAQPEDTSSLLSSDKAKLLSNADAKTAYASFLRIENPKVHGPEALPCAGCHVSTVVTRFAENALGMSSLGMPDAFTSPRDLTLRGHAATTPSSLRAFGWFKTQAMISRRVVHETASVLDDLDARFPARR